MAVLPEALIGESALPADNWLELEAAAGPGLEVFPNPFSGQATVRFFLPQAGTATVEVYNLQGQRIQPLAAGAYEAGSHELPWYGGAEGGKALESGVYLVRLITGEGILVKRVSFVR
ncbi:MAG: T9SS type A sorting domain-containing protein [Phaeodactylibacter sp.]|nr:T9SS type A sorting domain-containing protein [Phaeodactylibacter sp.]